MFVVRTSFASNLLSKADLPTLTVAYRTNEAIFLKTEQERCIVIFNMSFVDPDDQLLGKVFIEEFVYARKSLPASPSCSFSLVGESLHWCAYFAFFLLFSFHPKRTSA